MDELQAQALQISARVISQHVPAAPVFEPKKITSHHLTELPGGLSCPLPPALLFTNVSVPSTDLQSISKEQIDEVISSVSTFQHPASNQVSKPSGESKRARACESENTELSKAAETPPDDTPADDTPAYKRPDSESVAAYAVSSNLAAVDRRKRQIQLRKMWAGKIAPAKAWEPTISSSSVAGFAETETSALELNETPV